MLPVSLVSWRHLHERPCLDRAFPSVTNEKRDCWILLHGPRKVLPKDSSPIVFSLRLFKNKRHCKENMPNTKTARNKTCPCCGFKNSNLDPSTGKAYIDILIPKAPGRPAKQLLNRKVEGRISFCTRWREQRAPGLCLGQLSLKRIPNSPCTSPTNNLEKKMWNKVVVQKQPLALFAKDPNQRQIEGRTYDPQVLCHDHLGVWHAIGWHVGVLQNLHHDRKSMTNHQHHHLDHYCLNQIHTRATARKWMNIIQLHTITWCYLSGSLAVIYCRFSRHTTFTWWT